MPIRILGDKIEFPPVEEAMDGLLAIGGDLSPERLIHAYESGIFPWYSEGEPIFWHSPDPRMVLTPDRLRVTKRLRRVIKSGKFRLTMDRSFREVIEICAEIPRPTQDGTWITQEMQEAYTELHRRGLAHSVEVWSNDDELVGGLYGLSLGGAFFGESMFSKVTDASKVAFVTLVEQLERWGITLIDCQIYSEHLASLGAVPWSREKFLTVLGRLLKRPTREGTWDVGDV